MDISLAHFPILLLTLAFLSVTHGQYYDIFQGVQQFLQQYQPQNDFFSQYNNYQQPSRKPSRPEQHKKKTEDQRNVIKSPALYQYDYVLSTTPKPSRKSTKPNSNPTSKQTNRHHNTDLVNNYSSFEVTTKRNRVTTNNKKSTTVKPNNRLTTENIFGFSNNRGSNNYNRPVTENVFENNRRKEVYPVNNFEAQNSRRPDNTASNVDYTSNPNRATNNRNPNVQNINLNTQQNRVTDNGLNTRPTNTRNPDVSGINIQNQVIPNNRHPNSGPTTAALINSDHNSRGNNNYNTGNNRVTPNNDRVVLNTDNNGNNGNFYPNNPLINRPGVRPAPIDPNQPPITNKPVTDRNNFVTARPSDDFGSYGRPNEIPEILIGPDEDDMTEEQKRRYIDVAEKMCVRYKSLNVKEVVALPLLPSPDPVELNVSSCEPITVPLVIGGKVVSIKEFPHMALVGWRYNRASGYSWKCGGSLISDQYVLTAGHCTYEDRDSNTDSGPPQAVQLGSSYMNGPGALVVKISSVIRHPKYKMIRRYYDIALIKMARTVTFSEVIRPACLGVPPPVGDRVIATGWGRTEFGGDNSVELRSVSLPVWDMNECREIWGTSRRLPNGPTVENHMCAGERAGGKDTCQGDSGGPAQVQDGCVWRVVAVTSFGRSCGAPNTPALYIKTTRAFIAAQVFGSQIEQDIGSQGQRYDDRRPTYTRPQNFENRQSFAVNTFRRQ